MFSFMGEKNRFGVSSFKIFVKHFICATFCDAPLYSIARRYQAIKNH